VHASPAARALMGLMPAGISVAGTGKHGIITKGDVLVALARGPAAATGAKATGTGDKATPPAPATPAPAAPAASAASAATPLPAVKNAPSRDASAESFWLDESRGAFTDTPLTTMRRVIAARLSESKHTIPHFYSTMDVEIDAPLGLRAQLKSLGQPAPSMNDLVIKGVALALLQVPELNARLVDGAVVRNKEIDVSVAVATPGGLITPIVTAADSKSLAQISSSMKDLAERARANKLKPAEFQGGSISVSNLGMLGIDDFTAVISPPQAAILAVGSGTARLAAPASAKPGVEIALSQAKTVTVMTVALSADARIVSQASAARFLQVFRRLLENPASLM